MKRTEIRSSAGCGAAWLALASALACGRVEDALGRARSNRPPDSGAAPTPDAAPDAPASGDPGPVICGDGFVARLRAIPGSSPCAWALPAFSGAPLDPGHVNVSYEDNIGPKFLLQLSFVSSSPDCGSLLAWYYDDPATPAAIMGCPKTCALAATATDASFPGFTASLGCPLLPDPLK
jgi:hypothetical protein